MQRNPLKSIHWVAILVTTVVLIDPQIGAASNFIGASNATGCGPTDPSVNNVQDNRDMSYSRDALTAGMQSAVANVLNTDVAPTDINVEPEDTTPDSNTDVIFFDGDYGTYCGFDWHPDDVSDPDTNWIAGLTVCVSLSGSRCQQFGVYFDTSLMNAMNDDSDRTWACHETGHTLGLLHRLEACMPAQVPLNAHFFSGHDITHINGFY